MAELAVPNFTGAAEQQAAGNLTGAQTATTANRPNQFNPFGSATWAQDPAGQWTQTMQFSPEQKTLYDQWLQGGTQMGGAAQGALQNYMGIDPMGGTSANPAGLQNVADTLYQASTARLDPQWQQRQAGSQNQLMNQGLRPGMEAYGNAQRDLNFAQNDAYQQARAEAMRSAQSAQRGLFDMGQQSSNNALNQAVTARGKAAPQLPQFQNFYQQQATTGPNYLGALGEQYGGQLDIYNADVARQNAMMQGLFGIGSGIMGLPVSGGGTVGENLMNSGVNWLTGGGGGSSSEPVPWVDYDPTGP